MKVWMAILAGLGFMWGGGGVMAYEEPAYEVLESREDYEIRRYEGYLVAETVVEGEFERAGNTAFRRLFGYISGKNRKATKIDMTIPVTVQNQARPSDGEKIEMTIPVISTSPSAEREASSAFVYQFVMPAEYTLETLPIPEDARVVLKEVPGQVMAVRRYSGRSSKSRYQPHEQALLDALKADGLTPVGDPVFARYDGPFTPWFMRRNEVMVEVNP